MIFISHPNSKVPLFRNVQGGLLTFTGFALASPMLMLNSTLSNLKLGVYRTNSSQLYFFLVVAKADCFVFSSTEVFPTQMNTILSIILRNLLYSQTLLFSSVLCIADTICSWRLLSYSLFSMFLRHRGHLGLTNMASVMHFQQNICLQLIFVGWKYFYKHKEHFYYYRVYQSFFSSSFLYYFTSFNYLISYSTISFFSTDCSFSSKTTSFSSDKGFLFLFRIISSEHSCFSSIMLNSWGDSQMLSNYGFFYAGNYSFFFGFYLGFIVVADQMLSTLLYFFLGSQENYRLVYAI